MDYNAFTTRASCISALNGYAWRGLRSTSNGFGNGFLRELFSFCCLKWRKSDSRCVGKAFVASQNVGKKDIQINPKENFLQRFVWSSWRCLAMLQLLYILFYLVAHCCCPVNLWLHDSSPFSLLPWSSEMAMLES